MITFGEDPAGMKKHPMTTPPETKTRVLGTILFSATGLSFDAGIVDSVGSFIGTGIGAAIIFWIVGILVAAAVQQRAKDRADAQPRKSLMWHSWKYALIASLVFAGISALIWLLQTHGLDPV